MMKWVAVALLGLGCVAVVSSWQSRIEIAQERSEWIHAFDMVNRFERQVPESVLAQSAPQTIVLTIPNDHYWVHIAHRLTPRFFIMLSPRSGALLGPPPSHPLGAVEATITLNQVALPLEVETVRNEWGYVVPVKLGDQVELRLVRLPSGQAGDGTIIWGVDFWGDKEDHPAFSWSLSEEFAGLFFGCGVGLLIVGTLIVLFRRSPKANARVEP